MGWVTAPAVHAWVVWQAKRIETGGTHLSISDYRWTLEVPIAAIIDVRQNVWLGAGLVWLKLKLELELETPAALRPWGQWVAFYPLEGSPAAGENIVRARLSRNYWTYRAKPGSRTARRIFRP